MTGRNMPSKFDLLLERSDGKGDPNVKMAQQFNRHHGAKARTFGIGETVYYQMHHGNDWMWHPGVILKQLGETNFLINVKDRIIKAHKNQLQRRVSPIHQDNETDHYDYFDCNSYSCQNNQILESPLPQDDPNESRMTSSFDDADGEFSEEEVQIQPYVNDRPHRTTAGKLPEKYKDFVMAVLAKHA
uniref:Uncharacterized protein n=1 Tax=Photinus pyralis TaxID=7054 RepID=A0A1Y1LAK0_PHOPY